VIPLEFTIAGPPISLQAKSATKQRWKTAVAGAATVLLPSSVPPTNDDVALHITYYYDGDPPDVDNIIKPIQDALIGVVYLDDSQVVHAQSSRTRIDGSFTIRGASAVLLNGFSQREPFVYIRVIEPPDMSNLS